MRSPDTRGVLFDLAALGLLALFAALGARRGALASVMALAGLVGGYGAGAAAAATLGGAAATLLGVAAPLGAAAAGAAGFLVVALGLAVAGSRLRRARREAAPAPGDVLLGALFGTARGALVVLAVGLAALWSDAARTLAAPAPVAETTTPLRTATTAVLEAGAQAALGAERPEARMAARLVADPARTLRRLHDLLEHPAVAALASDREFWALVESGRAEIAVATPGFRRIAGDPELRSELAALGVVDRAAAADPRLFRIDARAALAEVGPRLRRLREDPELQALASDPTVAALAQRGDVLGLLQHPGFQRLLARALDAPTSG